MTATTNVSPLAATATRDDWRNTAMHVLPFVAIFSLAAILPAVSNEYWTLIATRAAIYWILVSGLNLIVGFAGQLAIGYVALLTLGAYTASVLVAGNVSPPLSPFAALGVAALVGAAFGVIVGLPALRLRTFYFAMSTLGFATIVTQIALAWQGVTGGGIGVPGPEFPAPFNTTTGLFYFCLGFALVCTWTTANIGHSRFGRALIAIRDSDVAAESVGVSKSRMLVSIFIVAGAFAAFAGGLFATLQTYITPDAFTFDLSVLFFISILIGGRGSILGPLLGTIILTLLPEFAAPLAAWSTFLYAVLLLVIVLAAPGGIAALLDFQNRRPLQGDRRIAPNSALVRENLPARASSGIIELRDIALSFGAVRAIDGVDLQVKPGQVHGLIGPNGSGKTTTLNVISGYYAPQRGSVSISGLGLEPGDAVGRAKHGIARTFQTPRIVGEASVLENVMVGGTIFGKGTLPETMLCLPRHRRDENELRAAATSALRAVGLEGLSSARADRLRHSELRFLEIARALMLRPKFILLDEPAAGLAGSEIASLGELIREMGRLGTGVLLVEHHADLIFEVCDQVTVLNLGKVLAHGSPEEVRQHKEVVSAYLGG